MAIVVSNSNITAEYFKNEMDFIELRAVMEEINRKEKNKFEKLRMSCFYNLLPSLKEGVNASDIMSFEWDVKEKEVINKEDINKSMQAALDNFYKNINN
jgi:hypothetical protein